MSDANVDLDRPPEPFQFSVRKMLVLVAVICVLCALLIPAFRAAHQAQLRQHCVSNLKMIAIALHNYHDTFRSFPPPISTDADGKPMHSWRVLISPYLVSSPFHGNYDISEPWNSQKNLTVANQHPLRIWTCPSARQPHDYRFTNYVMIVGKERTGPSGSHPDAIIVAEIADSDIPWTEPRDLNFDEMSFKINDKSKPSISSHHVHGAMAVYADGSVHFLDESTDPDEMRALLTANVEDASDRTK
jgi:hypothetical protein